jgi:hypothetical protein
MKLRRDKTVSASHTRWRVAQNAENRAFHFRKDRKTPTESRFFCQNFLLDSEFLNGKNILEVGCSPSAAIHSIREARFRVGIDPHCWRMDTFLRKKH